MNYTIKYFETEANKYFQHDYIVYADSMNVLNGFKPFKIASRLSVGRMKTPWCNARVADRMSFETYREAEEYLTQYFELCNIKYKKGELNLDKRTFKHSRGFLERRNLDSRSGADAYTDVLYT